MTYPQVAGGEHGGRFE